MKRPELILFARQPIPGETKTRLQTAMTPAQAAAVAAFMIRQTAELAAQSWPGDVYLYGAPDAEHPLFQELGRSLHLSLASQAAGDLGQRMRAALIQGIDRRGAAAVMGCDVPHCPGDILEKAHEQLARGRNVLGPTMDGGYYLIGLQRDVPELFDGVAWGGDQVLGETLARAARVAIEFEMLPVLRDVDTVDDLLAVAQDCPGLQPLLPDTAAKYFHLSNKPLA
jgi:rSAM/selenodomain-associated transferase 1